MNLFSLGKNKKLVIEKLKKFAEKSSFKFKLDGLYKINEDKKQKYNILKSVYFTYPMSYYSFLDFVKDLNNWTLSQLLHGEQGALLVASQLTSCAPTFNAKFP